MVLLQVREFVPFRTEVEQLPCTSFPVTLFVLGDDYDPANCLLSSGWRGILVEVDTR